MDRKALKESLIVSSLLLVGIIFLMSLLATGILTMLFLESVFGTVLAGIIVTIFGFIMLTTTIYIAYVKGWIQYE